jgi:hypothetical protein
MVFFVIRIFWFRLRNGCPKVLLGVVERTAAVTEAVKKDY